MLAAQRGTPPTHGKQGDVERVGHVAHAREGVGVAREVRRAVTAHDKSDRLPAHAGPRPAAVGVGGRNHRDLGVPDRNDITGDHLDRVEGEPGEQARRAPRQQHRRPGVEEGERGEVQVVGMQVRDHDRVHAAKRGLRRLARAAVQVQEGRGQHGVGEDAGAIVDPHGGVSCPGQAHRGVGHRANADLSDSSKAAERSARTGTGCSGASVSSRSV
jgi:hypothetical protein